MSKYLSLEQWKPSKEFLTSNVLERIIRENQNNLAILAGPGAGKTEILAQRASFLLQTATCRSPQKILALSFKNDAAANIQKRVVLRCGQELSRRFDSSTFDSFFISLVRRFITLLPDWINIHADFDVYSFDSNWWNEYEQFVLNGSPCLYRSTYSQSDRHSPSDLSQKPEDEIVKIWDYCSTKSVVDYAMCRSMAYTIIKNHSQVRNLILSTYQYLFLDEFQDITDFQYNFIKTVFDNSNVVITAVGDTNQMIMGWAGANPLNFKKLQSDFDSEIIPLAINHRSNSKIINLINFIIHDLTPQGEVAVVYEGTRKDPPPSRCLGARSFNCINDEGEYIAHYIKQLMQQNPGLKPCDFILVLRQKAQEYFVQVNDIFTMNGLHLRNEDMEVIKNGIKIQELMEEPLSSFLILLIRKRIGAINYEQEKELERLIASVVGYHMDQDREYKRLHKHLSDLISIINFSTPLKTIVSRVIENIGLTKLKNVFPQYRSKYLKKTENSFCAFFQEALDRNLQDIRLAIESYEGHNQIKLMTIHKSKSLEFDTVFFVDFHTSSWWGLENAVKDNNAKKQREEKNAFFVGLSRAKERLFFTRGQGDWPQTILNPLIESKLLIKLPDINK
ncbi:TPA: AAA family ATPase [Legionella pneumophila subsp. pneumophila]|uniref:UvrD-helicase domain-containing protein n=1 Tax=Legionella sp. PATHC039 TaxID=2992042 RepID=UPI001A327CC9|nr:ATP-dependent helicase [Legionella sp. PATHC039]MCW8395391.1 ATP-dependent helicase [Legionella sp. PATHC039]HAT8858785.1 AAA family ATPase [Legionella pneumophila subsp. pneumophila]HAT9652140.1 AAA family ATPase [Legionella pneumophila subsp. pneumophila]HAT9919483.1 AAA family ATPase [Legionella pneumophila subsp. pneumophila]